MGCEISNAILLMQNNGVLAGRSHRPLQFNLCHILLFDSYDITLIISIYLP